MRASRAFFAAFVLFAMMLGTTAASAQTECSASIPCGGVQSCLFSERLGDETGICVRLGCGGVTDTGRLAGACFGPLGDTPRDAFLGGDCDGDLIPNGMDLGALCDGGVVVSLGVTGRVQWHAPQRYDVADGAAIAPRDATSNVPDAIGIGCDASHACPALPNGPELSSRCVYLVRDPTIGEIGVCTYYVDDRDDRSCLATSFSGDGCLDDSGEPNERWEHGDCDRDGLINKLDPHVCSQLELMGQVSEGFAMCALGATDTSRCAGEVGEIASDQFGCTTEVTGAFAPFAYCCRSYEDCPMPFELGSPSRARCVFLADGPAGSPVGACTYVGTFVPDDDTCRAFTPPLGPTCMSGEVSYTAWANGHCDRACDDHANYADEVVCSICPDAGVSSDGGGPADSGGLDAGDLDAGALDAASEDAPGLDAATAPPASFAGSGCRCGLAHRAASSRALGLLVCLGAALVLARGALGRRRQR
jgi:hypothetical protein